MAKAKLTFKIMSYWHAGTGMGEGANLDAVVVKSSHGLPYLPGKTVKGLFKDAMLTATECNAVSSGGTLTCFGGPVSSRFDSEMACLEFTDATLGDAMEIWASQSANKDKIRQLFRRVSSTAIDGDGQALTDTLRTIEVAVPLTMTAYVESDGPTSGWITDLTASAPFIRYLGTHRHRGLGRVKVTVEVQT